jgi:hypothetical protein
MDDSSSRNIYRLLPWMFVFHILGAFALLLVAGFAGGLDLVGVNVPGLEATSVMLPIAFVLTIITLVLFPRFKKDVAESFGMLLLIAVIIINGVLVVEAFTVVHTWFKWLS